MTETPARATRRPQRTWSMFGDVKRKPTPYEVVTGKFHYHFRREPAPFEMDPQWSFNQWYLKHREGSPLQVADWEDFRDPAKLTYRDYVSLQHEREIYLDALVDRYEADKSVAGLTPQWVATLREFFVPLRFPMHVLQMASLYVGQMAPSSYITNCAHFQAADEMRRIQRIAYWTKVVSNAHGADIAETESARGPWTGDPAWQPLRETMEHLLVAFDWGEAFVALNVAVKPALDALVNQAFAEVAGDNGDEFLNALFTEFGSDARRSQDWTQALCRYAIEHEPDVAGTLQGWVDTWRPRAEAATAALSEVLSKAPGAPDAAALQSKVRVALDDLLAGTSI